MIKAYHISETFEKDIFALNEISFEMKKGEFIFITGPSGAGKTTLLRLLYAELLPTNGQLIVNGRNMSRINPQMIPHLRRGIGIVFQDFKLLFDRTVFENVSFVLESICIPPHFIYKRVMNALKIVGLVSRRNQMPHHLSGGEQQRVSIARAIANEPLLLLADEPTGNLDKQISAEILNIFIQLNNKGTTVIMATHDEELVARYNKRIIKLDRGNLIYDKKCIEDI